MTKQLILIKNLILLDKKAIEEIAQLKVATSIGIICIYLSSLASVIGVKQLFDQKPIPEYLSNIDIEFTYQLIISLSLYVVILNLLLICLFFLISKIFHHEGKFIHFFRVAAYANIINIVNIFPILNILNIWFIVVIFHSIKHTLKLSSLNSALTIITTILVLFAVLSSLS